MNSADRRREYVHGVSESSGRPTLTLLQHNRQIHYAVWRDVFKLAGLSYDCEGGTVFEFFLPERIAKAEEVLRGGMWVRKEVVGT